MKYITGIYALNLPCGLETTGDWHHDALNWSRPTLRESSCSFWGRFGIEKRKTENDDTVFVANHIRALLDFFTEGNLVMPQGMRNDFICNESYTPVIFEKVFEMKKMSHWKKIHQFMLKEYRMDWMNFLKGKMNG